PTLTLHYPLSLPDALPIFDRDLSLAGRVTFREGGRVQSLLIDFEQPIAVIPNLAIHLNREANQGWAINPQNELPPILAQLSGDRSEEHTSELQSRENLVCR